MKQFTDDEKLALLDKADQNGYNIGFHGWYQEAGILDREALQNALDPSKLYEPANWTVEETVDYDKASVVYDVETFAGQILAENLSADELYEFLDKLLTK